MADKARIGIIGTGWWATDAHMPAVLAHEDAELTAVCDTDPARLKAAAQAYDLANIVLGREENGSPGEVGWRTVELLDAG